MDIPLDVILKTLLQVVKVTNSVRLLETNTGTKTHVMMTAVVNVDGSNRTRTKLEGNTSGV